METRRRVLWVTALVSGLFFLYCITAGPVFFALVALGDHLPERATLIFITTVYRPHLATAYRSEAYFAYLSWWTRLGGSDSGQNHAEYREQYESDFLRTGSDGPQRE